MQIDQALNAIRDAVTDDTAITIVEELAALFGHPEVAAYIEGAQKAINALVAARKAAKTLSG